MRLRLQIRRHQLPDANIVWLVPAEDGSDTIASLVEKVNGVVPLESGDWGLEDYAVEIPGWGGNGQTGGFECLHFMEVGKIFKDDEEVLIRPLLTRDIRMRREGGRSQISMDGMKLIDGVPFGKSKPLKEKRIRRPPVEIPPLKRRRITYDEEEDSEGQENGHALEDTQAENGERQLVLHANFDDDDEEDDEDFNPDAGGEDEDEDADLEPENGGEDERQDGDGDNMIDDDHESDAESQAAEETNPLFEYYDNHGLPRGSIRSGNALEHMAKVLGESSQADAKSKKRSHSMLDKAESHARSKKVVFNEETTTPEGIEGDVNAPAALSNGNLEETVQEGDVTFPANGVKSNKDIEEEDEEEDESDSDSDDSDDTSSDDSSSDGDDDSDEDQGSSQAASEANPDGAREDENDSDDSSSSDSSSDSGSDSASDSNSAPEEISSKVTTPGNSISKTTTSHDIQAPKVAQQPTVPPWQGSEATKERNKRRASASAMRRMKERGIIPAETTKAEFNAAGLRNVSTLQEAEEALKSLQDQSTRAAEANAEFEARRKQLLESLASGGIEVGPGSPEVRQPQASETMTAAATAEDVEMGNTSTPTTTLPDNRKTPEATADASAANLIETPAATVAEMDAVNSNTTSPQKSYESPLGKPNCLEGLTFLFTGALEISRSQAKGLVTKYGGTVVEVPTTKTSYIVLGSNTGPTKLRKLEQMKVPKLDQAGFFELITKSMPQANKAADSAQEIPETPEAATQSPAKKQTTSSTAAETPTSVRQSRLNDASRRMLFGSLGLPTPKTKADEDKLRSDSMKTVRPIKPVKEPVVPEESANEKDLDSWREKINLRAAECCQDGIELSEPPFPFVQRWDPQQQGFWKKNGARGGKRKRNKRDHAQYYEDEEPEDKRDRRKRQKSGEFGGLGNLFGSDDVVLNYDEPAEPAQPSLENDKEHSDPKDMGVDGVMDADEAMDVDNVLVGDSQAEPVDLPFLPDDLSTLPKLNAGDAKAGMVIAFKHLVIGPNYQPQCSEYKTAVVLKVLESGDLELTLAKRDREEREYDENGDRIYGQFEMPLDDEDDEDDGFVMLSFAELNEPLIVQDAPDDLLVEDSMVMDNGNSGGHDSEIADQTTSGDGQNDQHLFDVNTDNAKDTLAEKQGSTDNSTTMDNDRNSPQKSAAAALDHDSPIKSIENRPDDEPAEAPLELTEDMLQESAEKSLAEGDIEVNKGQVSMLDSSGTKDARQSQGGGDDMVVDAHNESTFIAQNSLGKDDQSTPRPSSRQMEAMAREIQVPQTASNQEGSGADSQSTPRAELRGGDIANEIQNDDSFLDQANEQDDGNLTPRPSVRTDAFNDTDKTPTSITSSARKDVSQMIREAGFRTDVPSSILRENQLNVQNTPGDEAVFRKLMQEMAPTSDIYGSSPKFNGFASSSPVKAPGGERDLEMSPTPVTWENPTIASPENVQVGSASLHSNSEPNSVKYPKLTDLSSFTSQGVDHGRQPSFQYNVDESLQSFEGYDSLVRRQDAESSYVRATTLEEFPSAQPPRETSESRPPTREELGKSQAGVNVPKSTPAYSPISSPVLPPQRSASPQRSPSPQLPDNSHISSNPPAEIKKEKKKKKARDPTPVSDYFPSSDDSLPSLSFVMSQTQTRIKSEPRNSQSQSFIPAETSKIEKEYQAAMDRQDAEFYNEDEDDEDDFRPSQRLPKQRNRAVSTAVQKTKVVKKETTRKSLAPAPKPSNINTRLSQAPRPSQPSASQMIDLTLSSSPIEEVPPQSQIFHTAPESGSGWVEKSSRGKSMGAEGSRVSSAQGRAIPKTKWASKGDGGDVESAVRRRTYGDGRY